MDEPERKEVLRRRLRERSREIVWALFLTLLAFGVIVATFVGS